MDIAELKDKSIEGIGAYLQETLDELLEVTEDTLYGIVIMQESGSATISQTNKNIHQLSLMIIAIIQNDAFSRKDRQTIETVLEKVIANA